MEPKNIKEFQALVQRYETITLEEIKDKYVKPHEYMPDTTAHKTTGFGAISTCTLCLAVGRKWDNNAQCFVCVYEGLYGCSSGVNRESYRRIANAATPQELLYAFRNRAKHLRKTYPQYL